MNTQLTHEVLLHILELTHYNGDKEKLINHYLRLVMATAINDLIKLRENSVQGEITKALTVKLESEEQVIQILRTYFEQIIIEEAFKKASERCLTTVLKDLLSNVSADEEKKISDYIATLITHQ